MGLLKMNQLYRSVVLDHANHPRHYGPLAMPTADVVLRNPSCGDVIRVQAEVKAGQIEAIAFQGSGCTISMASTSMMTQALLGQSVADGQQIVQAFLANIVDKQISEQAADQLGDAALLSSVAQFPTRIRCATLGWHAVEKILNE